MRGRGMGVWGIGVGWWWKGVNGTVNVHCTVCRGLRQPHQSNITCLTYVPNFLVIIQKIISF